MTSLFFSAITLCRQTGKYDLVIRRINERRHDKSNKMAVCPVKTQISLGIHPVWSETSLSAWRKLGSLATHWAHSKDSDQTGRMPRLIWVFAGCTLILLVLSCRASNGSCKYHEIILQSVNLPYEIMSLYCKAILLAEKLIGKIKCAHLIL